MFFQLVYSSIATKEFWPDDLFALVEKSRRRNAERAITGMLLFCEGEFLQLIEGPEPAVRELFAAVELDQRHRSVRVLLAARCEERNFPDWTMGCERLEDAWNLPRAWSSILEEGFHGITSNHHPSAAKDLLMSFYGTREETAVGFA